MSNIKLVDNNWSMTSLAPGTSSTAITAPSVSNDAASLYLKSAVGEVDDEPAANYSIGNIGWTDVNNSAMGYMQSVALAGGGNRLRFTACCKDDNNDSKSNNVFLDVKKDGSCDVQITGAARKGWHKALNALPVSVSMTAPSLPSGVTSATVTGYRVGYIVFLVVEVVISADVGTTFQAIRTGLPAPSTRYWYTLTRSNASTYSKALLVDVHTNGQLRVANGSAGTYRDTLIYTLPDTYL